MPVQNISKKDLEERKKRLEKSYNEFFDILDEVKNQYKNLEKEFGKIEDKEKIKQVLQKIVNLKE